MKNKSTRHKDANTFKFQPFSERISNIDVDIFHKVSHEYEAQTDEEASYFYQAIQNWNVLNLSEGYEKFKRDIKAHNYIVLPQVLLAKDHIVETLLIHLNKRNPLYLQPVLEVVIAVAQDLQKEFYPYYPKFLQIIIELLNTKDTEQLEWTFTCLAHLFKILWRPMIKNINGVFTSLLPLLSDARPEYVNAFAAESFAFVARKVKDRASFLGLLLKTVHKKKDGISGCGKLLFEVINGVDGQFHNCAEQFLPFYLDCLWNQPLEFQETWFEILEQIILNIAGNIHHQKLKLLWDVFQKNLERVQEPFIVENQKQVEQLLKLIGQMVEFKNGKCLQDPGCLIHQMIKMFSITELPEDVLLILVQISISILLSKVIRLQQEQASQLILKILSLNRKQVLLYFVENVNSCSLFETMILPSFLRKCGNYHMDTDSLSTLTKLVLRKRPLSGSSVNLSTWEKYPLNFKDFSLEVYQHFLELLDISDSAELENKKEAYFCTLVCLAHLEVKMEQKNIVIEKLKTMLDLLMKILDGDLADIEIKKFLFWVNIVMESVIHLGGSDMLNKYFPSLFGILLKYSNHLAGLKSLSLLVCSLQDSSAVINIDILRKLDSVCQVHFNSPYHELRLITAHIYTFFERLPQFELEHSSNPDIPKDPFKVFTLIYQVESIEPLVHTYRDQLQRLEKLNFDKPQMIMCNKTEFKLVPLRYLCGALYMNFKLLWDPICKCIETQAHGLEINDFWSVYGTELINVVPKVKATNKADLEVFQTDLEDFKDYYQEMGKLSGKPDFINYRMLLWQAARGFADVAEAKTRDVSQLLLTFIEDEYTNTNAEMATVCNIKTFSKTDAEDVEEPEEEENGKHAKVGRKTLIKTLLHKLSIFAQFKSPKSMYREPELYRLYFDFLKHRNAEIQKAALDCLTTYKFKYLTPYKDHLYNLIDEKNFKNEITNFRVDKESAEIQTDHRENFIPVMLQIVFSKMSSKSGLRTGGKASGQNRRNLILRFLAGCEESEMLTFVQKAFTLYSKYVQEDEMVMVEGIVKGIDLEKCLAPKKLLSTINLLNVILDQFGGLMGNNLLTYLLKILFIVGALIRGIFERGDKVHSGYSAILRNIRTASIKTLERFFEHFEKYPWNRVQINAIFVTFVWPYLDKLNIEGIHSPTSLLRLIKQWASKPRYFKLLVKHEPNNSEQYILPHVFKLLLNEKSKISVVNVIYEMVESMLKYEASEEEADLDIQVDHILPIEKSILDKCKVNEKLNYGSCILLQHVPVILQKIKKKLENKKKSLNKIELFILCRISELVWEGDVSDSILQLLMPIVLKKCTSDEDVVLQFVSTVQNLLKNVDIPDKHLRNLSPLFAEVSYSSCRKILVNTLEYVAEKSLSVDFKSALALLTELNAFDAKWIDQPNFERRHGAFKKIQQRMQEEEPLDASCGALFIYNLYYTLMHEKDLSLKDNASHTLRTLTPLLLQKHQSKDLDYLLNTCIFTLIKKGLRNNGNAELRNECISLLGCLARECPNVHFTLRDLHVFCNKTDMEVDFFENLTHLQMHRHARAMTKFCQTVREQTVALNPKTITQFLLPLATHYLCSEKYSGKNAIVDAAIEMVGVICRIAPWHQYEGILKFALSKLRYKAEFQKQLVRLVVVILDAFHFDLTKGHGERNDVVEDQVDHLDINDNVEEEEEESAQDEGGEVGEEIFEDEGVEADEEEVEQIINNEEKQKIVDKITVLCKSTATRVIKTIQNVLLPQLHKSLAQLTNYDSAHKVNRKRTGIEREEEDLARVPISLAVVKLLQRLPTTILDLNLPAVFLKLCTFLKSRLESVRRIARETLQKIMLTLGAKYLGMLLREIAPLMNRGYQVHVLVFTVHGVLSCLKGTYQPKDIDQVLLSVLNLCTADLFGILSEEREIVKITTKVSEAKSTKSYDTLQILAQHITETCLMDIILPIKQHLEATHSFKTVHKAQDALKHIALGLVDNQFVSIESLLKFAYGTSAEKIPKLLPAKKKKLTEEDKAQQQRQREDCFIIPKIPGNRTAYRELNVKTSSNTNAHLLVEFGLRLCLVMLKRDKVKDVEYKPFIDPFVAVFKNCLKSKHVKLCSLTLQCLQWVMKYELPSMKSNIKPVTKEMFAILHKFAAAGLTKGDNFDLVVAAFKAMTVLVRDVQYYHVNTTQLKALLLYVEQDMHDHNRQATAFGLLKAIISRKLNVPEIHDVMTKVAQLSITSELNHVRSQARSVFHHFIMEYPLGNALEKHLSFYLSQMNFEMQYGRESAIEMINLFISSFPSKVLKNHSGTLLITLSARLVNDDVPECRKMVAECLSSMLKKLTKADRDSLFEILTLWLKDNELSHRRLAAQLCGIFVTVEKQEFESRLPVLIPLILKQFGLNNVKSGKFVRVKKEKDAPEEVQRLKDHHHFQVLQLVLKICVECPVFLKQTQTVENLAYYVQTLLGYPHDWVRLAAAQFIGFILSSMDVEELSTLLLEDKSAEGYLKTDPEPCIKSLTLDLCDQLQPGVVKSDLAEQVIKNLVFIARVLEKVSNKGDKKINLTWLTKLMRKVVNSEVIHNNNSTVLRMEVFKWIAGVITILDMENIRPVMHHLLAPLVREMITTEEKNAPLRQLAKEVANHLKKRIGMEEYTKTLQKLQQNLTVKRAERKRERTQLAVTDPEVYAKKKIKIHEKKKISKKRKLEEIRGKKTFKKRKVIDLEHNSEVM